MSTSPPHDFEEPHRLYPGKFKWTMILLLSTVFVVIGLWLGWAEGSKGGWSMAAVFGAVGAIAIISMNGTGSWLELRADAFTISALGRKTIIAWNDCSPFTVSKIGHNKTVMFDQHSKRNTAASRFARFFARHSGALPDTYGMKAEDLATLMNAYRDRAHNA